MLVVGLSGDPILLVAPNVTIMPKRHYAVWSEFRVVKENGDGVCRARSNTARTVFTLR